MAQIEDPKKVFQFGFLAAGLNPFEVQKVDIPDFEIEVVEHGDTNYDVKTGGRIKFGDVTLEKLRPMSGGRGRTNWIWDWIQSIVDTDFGSIGNSFFYKRNNDIVQYNYDGLSITDRW